MDDSIALILGGGAGSRLFPLTLLRSKPAVPLAGKYRLIDVPVSNSIHSGLHRIFVLTQYNSASLNRHLARTYQFDTFRRGFVSVMAAEQTRASSDWFQGTADAVRQVIPHFSIYRNKYVFILSGDQLYSMDYRQMLAHHKARGAAVSVATIPVTASDASGFGILKTDDQDRITDFHEKPSDLSGKDSLVSRSMHEQGRHYLASMGIYCFNKEVLCGMLDSWPDDHDFGKQIIPRTIEQCSAVSYPFNGSWSDIGTIRSFYDANLSLASSAPGFSLSNMRLYTHARMLAPTRISGSTIEESLISEGSFIGASDIDGCVIGIRSRIGNGCTIRGSIIMGADYDPWRSRQSGDRIDGPEHPGVGDHVYIEGAIVDKNVQIGSGCIIRNTDGVQEHDGDSYYIRDGIVVVPKNVTIPEGTVI